MKIVRNALAFGMGILASFAWQVVNAQPLRSTSAEVGGYFAPGTLAYHLSTNATGRAAGYSGQYAEMVECQAPASTNLDRLTHARWSTDFWLKGVRGLSATPIGFSNVLGGQGLPTMVSPRHYLCSTHMHVEGYMMAFLDTNNVLYWRTTVQRVDITNSALADTSVGLIDADLPPSVGFLPVLPANYASYIPTNGFILQGIGMNQDFRLFGQPMSILPGYVWWNSAAQAPCGLNTNWNVTIRGGDSSCPEMLLIGNQLVLTSHNLASFAGPNYAASIDVINRQMHSLSRNNKLRSDYQLTVFPLAKWRTIQVN